MRRARSHPDTTTAGLLPDGTKTAEIKGGFAARAYRAAARRRTVRSQRRRGYRSDLEPQVLGRHPGRRLAMLGRPVDGPGDVPAEHTDRGQQQHPAEAPNGPLAS